MKKKLPVPQKFIQKLYEKAFFMENYHPPRTMEKEHWHNHIEFNYFFSGSMEYLFGGQKCRFPTGQIAFFWGGIPHRATRIIPAPDGSPAKLANLYIPLDNFLLWDKTSSIKNLLITGNILVLKAPEVFLSRLVEIWSQDIENRKDKAMESVSFDIRSLINRYSYDILFSSDIHEKDNRQPASPHERPENHDRSIQKQKTLVKILGFILIHLQEAITMHDIAAETKYHPNYVRRIFQEQLGISVHQFINSLRLSYACSLLRETDLSILEISIEAGFGSVSQFYKAFQKNRHQPPNQYRNQIFIQESEDSTATKNQ